MWAGRACGDLTAGRRPAGLRDGIAGAILLTRFRPRWDLPGPAHGDQEPLNFQVLRQLAAP